MSNHETLKMEQSRGSSRRSFLKGTIASSVVAFGLSGMTTTVAADDAGTRDEAMICDVGMNRAFRNTMGLDGSPPGEAEDRDTVVHVTSRGRETTDYVCSTVDVSELGVAVGDVAKGRNLTYDYYEGERNAGVAPDEVFLIVRDTGGDEERIYVAFQTLNANRPAGKWFTRNVSAEINGRGRGWRAVRVSSDRIDVEDELVTTTNRVIIETILSLRGGERFNSVVEEFGRDAELLAVAIGKGNTRQPTTVDVYFDDLVVADRTFDVPAVVNSSATFDPKTIGPSEEGFHVHLQFEDTALEDAGLALEDIALDSVMLSGYAPIAPPIAGTDIQSAAVSRENGATGRTTDEGIRVDFDPDAVANLLEPGTTTVLLFGEFAVDRPLSFLATGEITFEE